MQNYASEQSYQADKPPATVKPVKPKPARQVKPRKSAADIAEQIRKELEVDLRVKITAELEEKINSKLAIEYQHKLENALSKQEAIKQEKPRETKNQPIITNNFDMETKKIVEAILFAAEKPMTPKQLQKIYPEIERPELKVIQEAIDSIIEDYRVRPVGLMKLASGYSFQVKEGYAYWVSRVFEDKPPKYSRALLETLAIIAYRQPVTRGDIEDIRGVSVSSNIIRTLLDREWIRVIAHKEVPGRPALYGSTKQFLDYFNLSSLDQLPTLDEIKDLDFLSEKVEISSDELDTEIDQEIIKDKIFQAPVTVKEKTIEEQAIEEAEREEQEIIELVLENRQ